MQMDDKETTARPHPGKSRNDDSPCRWERHVQPQVPAPGATTEWQDAHSLPSEGVRNDYLERSPWKRRVHEGISCRPQGRSAAEHPSWRKQAVCSFRNIALADHWVLRVSSVQTRG